MTLAQAKDERISSILISRGGQLLFPQPIDNRYRGRKLALWVFGLLPVSLKMTGAFSRGPRGLCRPGLKSRATYGRPLPGLQWKSRRDGRR